MPLLRSVVRSEKLPRDAPILPQTGFGTGRGRTCLRFRYACSGLSTDKIMPVFPGCHAHGTNRLRPQQAPQEESNLPYSYQISASEQESNLH